jgi:hypothetical protein
MIEGTTSCPCAAIKSSVFSVQNSCIEMVALA